MLTHSFSLILVAFSLIFFSTPAAATPDLRLFIPPEYGGFYDETTETWVTTSEDFVLEAIVDDEDVFRGEDTVELTLCVALSDDLYTIDGEGNVVLDEGLSLSINGETLTSADFEYGLAPISEENPDGEGGDLPPHDHYPTAFTEVTITIDDPGTFEFLIEGAVAGIHFDLYTLDENGEIDFFAPFSHDAGTVVPEPSTAALLLTGLLFLPIGRHLRRRRLR